jgi:signal transduction histidine kinase
VEIDGVDHSVLGQETLLTQVITNLLSNAAKFTEGGRITLAGGRMAER